LERGGTVGATYTSQVGRYVKIGSLVHAYCNVSTSAITSQSSGYNIVSGLPFAYNGDSYATIGAVSSNMFNTTAVSKAFPSTSGVYFGVDESASFPPKQLVWTSGNLRFSFSYYTT
jgi:DeoR/GlpR family transcriptional regulator of sugar metabolism